MDLPNHISILGPWLLPLYTPATSATRPHIIRHRLAPLRASGYIGITRFPYAREKIHECHCHRRSDRRSLACWPVPAAADTIRAGPEKEPGPGIADDRAAARPAEPFLHPGAKLCQDGNLGRHCGYAPR